MHQCLYILYSLFLLLSNDSKSQTNLAYAVDEIDPLIYKSAHVIIQKEEMTVEFKDVDNVITRRHQVVTIKNRKGEDFIDLRAFYKEGTEKIQKVIYNVYDRDGNLIRQARKKDFEDYADQDGALISDGRWLTYDFETNQYPITIEKSWITESESTLNFRTWIPIPSSNVAVVYSSYRIINQTSIPIHLGKRNLDKYNITSVDKYNFVLKDQLPIYQESYSPRSLDIYPIIYARPQSYNYEGYKGEYEDWDDFGSWMHSQLLSGQFDLDLKEVRDELKPVIQGTTDKREIVKKLYDYVQENTRYILIGLDEGGYVPLSTSKVHKVKYGDCKALSFYMKALLEAFDIPANYVIIRSGTRMPEDIYPEYPATVPADHAILNVPLDRDTVWLDCTSNDNPFNFLGSFTDDRLALQVNSSGGALVRTPRYTEDQNREHTSGHVVVNDSGDIEAEISIESHGLKMPIGFALQKKDEDQYLEYINKQRFKSLDRVVIHSKDIAIDEEQLLTTESFKLSADRYIETAGNYLIINSSLLPMFIPRLKKDSDRVHDIHFPRSEKYSSSISYELPDSYRVRIPNEINIEGVYGRFERKVTPETNNKFRIDQTFVLNKGTYSNTDYNEIKSFFDQIRKKYSTQLSATNKS